MSRESIAHLHRRGRTKSPFRSIGEDRGWQRRRQAGRATEPSAVRTGASLFSSFVCPGVDRPTHKSPSTQLRIIIPTARCLSTRCRVARSAGRCGRRGRQGQILAARWAHVVSTPRVFVAASNTTERTRREHVELPSHRCNWNDLAQRRLGGGRAPARGRRGGVRPRAGRDRHLAVRRFRVTSMMIWYAAGGSRSRWWAPTSSSLAGSRSGLGGTAGNSSCLPRGMRRPRSSCRSTGSTCAAKCGSTVTHLG